jgi:polar amino acid transport system substrate-binding protein
VSFDDIDSGLEVVEKGDIEAFIYDEPILKYRVKECASDKIEIVPIRFDQELYAFGISNRHGDLEKQI